MRIFLSVVICITFIGGLGLYMNNRATALPGPGQDYQVQAAKAQYSLLITTTFAIEPDPFAVQIDDDAQAAGLIVRLGKKEILRQTGDMESGVPVIVKPLEGLVIGNNEIYLEASPPLQDSNKSHAVRVQIMENDILIAEKTSWSQPGGKVADTMSFSIETQEKKEDDHDH